MFVQVIQARATDLAGLEKMWRRWNEELKPHATGYLGSTAGVTDDGSFVAIARFESEEAARQNSDRPEQGQWWSEMSNYLEDPVFHDCTEVETWLGGGSDDAGFVQVIQGPGDEDQAQPTPEEEEQIRAARPDLIGGISAKHSDDGNWTTVAYFRDEQSAREGERKQEFQDYQQEHGTNLDARTYFDLRNPWLDSK